MGMSRAQVDDLVARMELARLPSSWVRAARVGASSVGQCTVDLPDGGRLTVRLAERGEGPAGALVAVIEREGGTRTIKATVETDGIPRRSVRVSDETWAELAQYGEPSAVLREAAEEYLARRR